jgi:hypothetical protein
MRSHGALTEGGREILTESLHPSKFKCVVPTWYLGDSSSSEGPFIKCRLLWLMHFPKFSPAGSAARCKTPIAEPIISVLPLELRGKVNPKDRYHWVPSSAQIRMRRSPSPFYIASSPKNPAHRTTLSALPGSTTRPRRNYGEHCRRVCCRCDCSAVHFEHDGVDILFQ